MALAASAMLAAASLVGCGSDEREPAKGATTVTAGGVVVEAIVRQPGASPEADPLPTVLFLHGAAYTSRIWDDRGILDAVANAGHRAVAIDLPGYGETPKRPAGAGVDASSDGTWLRSLIEELGGPEQVVLVSPSMSGRFSLGYLAEFPDDALAGFVPIAPVTIDAVRSADAPPVPTMIVWGEDDDKPLAEADALAKQFPGSSIEVISDGSHAAYDDEPEAFIALLVKFLGQL